MHVSRMAVFGIDYAPGKRSGKDDKVAGGRSIVAKAGLVLYSAITMT
jgi:hypothetical protein